MATCTAGGHAAADSGSCASQMQQALRRTRPHAKADTWPSIGPSAHATGAGPLSALFSARDLCTRQRQLLLLSVPLLLLLLAAGPQAAAADAATFRNVTVAAPQDGGPWFECGFYTLSYKVERGLAGGDRDTVVG